MSIEIRKGDGTAYRGWTSASVSAGIEQMARSFIFEFSVTDAGSDAVDLIAGEAVEVWADDTPLLTGYIDDMELSYDGEHDTVTITGRSATQDAVDSSASVKPLRNVTLRTLAESLCAPYGVDVFDQAGVVTAITRGRPNAGDSIGDYIQARARDLNVLVTDDEVGRLVLYRPSSPPASATVIERGRNVLAAQGRFSVAERFSQYEVRGVVLTESDVIAGAPGIARDYGVTRPRRKVIVPDRGLAAAGSLRAAEWEALTRIGRGQSVIYTLSGWYQDDGELWRPGLLVEINDARMKISGARWLITDVAWSIDSETGRRVDLTVQPLEAFQPMPPPGRRAPATGKSSSHWLIEKGGKIVAPSTVPE